MDTGLAALHLVKAFVTLLPCFKMFAATKTAGLCRTRKPRGAGKYLSPANCLCSCKKAPPNLISETFFLYFHDTIIAHLNVTLCGFFTIS